MTIFQLQNLKNQILTIKMIIEIQSPHVVNLDLSFFVIEFWSPYELGPMSS